MIQPGEFAPQPKPPKNPPPPKLIDELGASYELSDMTWSASVLRDGVLLRFSQETVFVVMSARAARQLARTLLEKADDLDAKLAKAAPAAP